MSPSANPTVEAPDSKDRRGGLICGLRLWRRVVSAVLSGILLIFCFPRFDLTALAWVALIPLLAAIEGASLRRAFWLGGLCGMIGYAGILSWLTSTMTRFGGLPIPVALLVMLMLAAYVSLYLGAFCALLCRIGRKDTGLRWVAAPFLWVALELGRSYLLTGFPWASLGYSQYRWLSVLQISDITGFYGVSFLVVLVNATLWTILRRYLPGGSKSDTRLSRWALMGTAVLMAAVLLYGRARLETFSSFAEDNPERAVRVALLQGNIPQDQKWNESFRRKTLDVYRELTYRTAQKKPDLIVWPETAAPFFFFRDRAYRQMLLDLSADVKAPLLVGVLSAVVRDREYRLQNSAFQVTPEKKVDGRYDKMHLVPYGEFVPLRRFFPFIRKMVSGIGDFEAGDRLTVFRHAKVPFSVLICYEVIFAEEVRRFVRNGARMLVNITNDAWFGRSAAPFQHMAIAAVRAVENRVPLIRAANTGITGVVDATGRIRDATALFVRTGVVTTVQPGTPGLNGLSFYARHGDIFAFLCAAVTLLGLGWSWRADGRTGGRPNTR